MPPTKSERTVKVTVMIWHMLYDLRENILIRVPKGMSDEEVLAKLVAKIKR